MLGCWYVDKFPFTHSYRSLYIVVTLLVRVPIGMSFVNYSEIQLP